MAKVNFGTIANDARGKINGTVYSKNKSGSYVRRKVTPANPNTVAQSTARNNFGGLSKAWSGHLTPAQRAAWITYANTYPRLDVFGASIQLSGLNMFISLNTVLLQAGLAEVDDPPASNVVGIIPINPAGLDANATAQTITFAQSAVGPAGSQFYVFGSRPLPAGRTVQRNDFRFLGAPASEAGPYDKAISVTAAYLAKFGPFVAGQNIALLVASMDTASGLTTVGVSMSKLAY